MEMLPQETAAESPLKQAVAARLAAHRAKKGRVEPAAEAPARTLAARSEAVRQAVMDRYAHSQSYREFLAAEAERAVHEAQAAAEVATRSAEAVARAQMELLQELDEWSTQPRSAAQMDLSEAVQGTVQVIEPAVEQPLPEAVMAAAPANVIEFPRLPGEEAAAAAAQVVAEQIVVSAAQKMEAAELDLKAAALDPKTATLDPKTATPEIEAEEQLQIFEVDAAQRLSAPAAAAERVQWSPLVLDARPSPRAETETAFAMLPQTASLELRLLAGLVDGCLVLMTALAFITVAALQMHHLPKGTLAAGCCVVTVVMLLGLYQTLFFTLSVATPGMLYARIGLCTFSDENPTRSAMWRRSLIMMLSAAPLGLGFLWAWLDEDGLGWHDRITRIYQRSY